MTKLGLIAGAGSLPVEIAEHCVRSGRPFFVIRLKGFAGPELAAHEGADIGIGEVGKCLKALRAAGCEAVCLAGRVTRPDFSALAADLRGLSLIPAAIAAGRKGDDALLRLLVNEFEKEGFAVEGAEEAAGDLGLPAGVLAGPQPSPEQLADARQALDVARAIGRLDIGQAAVVCSGLVLAVEAQEGTDAMLARVAGLPDEIRGSDRLRRGALAKAPKPIQETRIDLPTIGAATVRNAAAAGLAGIVGEAGRMLVLDRREVVRLADELGLFVLGVESRGQ